jgi:hypothetical protein
VAEGIKSIFSESWKMCIDNDEASKYLMTFQNLLSRVPKWNSVIVEEERKRIIERSGCNYLEDLITCVHIIQLKVLTSIRVGNKQKKIDISIPKLDHFIHKVYINVARKIYTNIYLFEKNIAPLQVQKHNRELELIIKECIMNSVRESIPVETILRAYMDETDEHDVEVNEVEEQIPIVEEPMPVAEPPPPPTPQTTVPITEPVAVDKSQSRLSFSDIDQAVDIKGIESSVSAPKTIERLESLALQKVKEEDTDTDDDDDDERLTIGGDVALDISDVNDLNRSMKILPPPILDDIEILS